MVNVTDLMDELLLHHPTCVYSLYTRVCVVVLAMTSCQTGGRSGDRPARRCCMMGAQRKTYSRDSDTDCGTQLHGSNDQTTAITRNADIRLLQRVGARRNFALATTVNLF